MQSIWVITVFLLKPLVGLWYRLPALMILVHCLYAYVNSNALTQNVWLIDILFFTILLMLSFEQTIRQDVKDGSLFWMVGCGINPYIIFVGRVLSYFLVMGFPLILTILVLSNGQLLYKTVGLILLTLHILCLVPAIAVCNFRSDSTYFASFIFALLPLQIPPFLIVSGIFNQNEDMQIVMLFGTVLISTGIGMLSFNKAMCFSLSS